MEALLKMGLFGTGRYASNFNVKTLLGGAASIDMHISTITKICQLILVRDQNSRLPKGMQLNKSLKSIETVLNFCVAEKWIESTPLFPSYLTLDTDRVDDLNDQPINALHELRVQKDDLDQKLNMLEATDRPIRDEFKVMNEDSTINYGLLSTLNNKEQTDHSSNVKKIAEYLDQLRKLGGKSIMKRNFSEVDHDRTIDFKADDLDVLKTSLQSSIEFNKKRFNCLAAFRSLENQHQKLLNYHNETKYEVD